MLSFRCLHEVVACLCAQNLYHLINVFHLIQNSVVNFPKSRLVLQTHNEILAHCQKPMNYYNHIYTLFFDSVDGREINDSDHTNLDSIYRLEYHGQNK